MGPFDTWANDVPGNSDPLLVTTPHARFCLGGNIGDPSSYLATVFDLLAILVFIAFLGARSFARSRRVAAH